MSKKTTKDKKSPPLPKPNRQIPISLVRKTALIEPGLPLQHARDYSLYGCWIMAGWQDAGITPVIVAREQEPGKIMFGVYMVDLYCLGIKDVYTRTDYSVNRFERELPKMCSGAPQQCSVELAHEVIYGGLEYAEKLGFQPHPDYHKQMADLMLDPPDAHPRVDHVSFGKDGKPLYVSGPYDDERKINFVMKTLTRTCGAGNFNYLVGVGGMPE
jgi:hypothetical protein